MLSVGTVALLVLAIAPFLVLARFAHPSYDDWCAAEYMRTLGFWDAAKVWYDNWAGRFTAIGLWNVIPISKASLEGYAAFPLSVLIGLLLAFFWLGRELAGGMGIARVTLLVLAACGVYLFSMASPAEGFYWYSGATVTMTGAIFAIAAMAAAIHAQRGASSAAAWSWSGIAGVFALLASGSNEIVLLPFGLVLIALVWLARRMHQPRWHLWLVPLSFTVIAGIVDVLAPGNYKRAASTGGLKGVVAPLLGSVATSAAAIFDWISRGPILIGAMLILLAGIAAAPRVPAGSVWRRTSWMVPGLVAVAGVWGIFFFTHWASGFGLRPPPERVVNMGLLYFGLLAGPMMFMLGVQLLDRFHPVVSDVRDARPWVMLALAASLFGHGNVREAYVDLLAGRAATYDRELNERYDLLRRRAGGGGSEAVTVAPLTRIPVSIHFKDITDDPTHPHNRCYARFWEIPSVHVR